MKGKSTCSFSFSLALIAFLGLANGVQAKDKWYRVEVLVFETKSKSAQEQWPSNPGKPSLKNAVNLVDDQQAPFGQLPENQLTLNDAKKKIQKNYHLVLHRGWRQPITENQAQTIHLFGGKQYAQNNGEAYEVDGVIKLTAGRFLHVDTDLLFNKPTTITSPEGNMASTFQAIRLKETSRLRLEEIHYIDHPWYGIIITVTPDSQKA